MKTYNIKTYRTVEFELNHCVEAEDERSAMVRCINWFENDREIMDDVKNLLLALLHLLCNYLLLLSV